MNKHVTLAILLIAIFFIFTTCGAKEMFNPSPDAVVVTEDEVMNDIIADVPVDTDPAVTDAMSPTMNSDFDVDLSNGQPAAPIPSTESEMGYYNFAKTMYM